MNPKRCPLCQETKEIVSSHLIPAALYDYCRPPGGNPVAFNSELVIETSRQQQHPLLCRECEELLNKNGENWIVPLFARLDGSFPFYDLLTRMAPAVVDGDSAMYAAARNPEIDTEKLIHFAMGIFWKAAVHSWSGSRSEPLIDLGPYAEPIRKYLKGENALPKGIVLMIGVLRKPVKHIAFNAPYRGSASDWHNFLLYILGIEFTILVGKAVGPEEREASFSGNPERPILLGDFVSVIQDIAVAVMKKARKAKNVEKYLKRPAT